MVGHTGAGKTTLTNLLLRFYDVQRGAFDWAESDIRDSIYRSCGSIFGVVLQDPYLFTGTVARKHSTRHAEYLATTKYGARCRAGKSKDYLDALPDRFDTTMRERGSRFSTGQKQLISFARALAHDPRS